MPKYGNEKKQKGESKPNYYDSNMSRSEAEAKEGLDTASNGTAPGTRYDTKQQIGNTENSLNAETPKTGFTKKTTSAGGSAVKQEVASKVLLADADYAGLSGTSVNAAPSKSGLKSLQYSGDAGSILGTAANTPVVGQPNRSEGRFDRKLDSVTKKIDFLASEQVITEYKNPKPLGESGSEVQGYYGTPKNTSYRSQKTAGGTPASLLVERSADEISRDELIFVTGQYVKSDLGTSGVYDVEPNKTSTFTNGVRAETTLMGADAITYGNFTNRSMTVQIKKDSSSSNPYVAKIAFDSIDNSAQETEAVVNSASTNWIIDMNADEIARQAIDDKAGRETELNWNPLGRGVPNPTQTVGLLRRLEEDLGANVFTAYKFASKSHAYQLNKAAKDGQRVHTPMREMIIGNIGADLSSEDYSSGTYYNGKSTIFDSDLYKAGAASLLIALFDSPNKYSTKADILLQPRSLRRAFQIADNNMDVFRLKKEFVAALNNRDVFSTIDRGYDPLLPVCITDRVGLISPISYARFGDFTRSAAGADRTYSHARFTYAYSNRSSNYVIDVGHPLLDGIADFFEQHCDKIFSLCNGTTGTGANDGAIIKIPIMYSTTTMSLWQFLLLYAVPFMQKNRINSMRDILDYEVNFEYPFDFIPISEANPRNAVNYGFTDIDSPLVSREMIPSVAMTWILPEFFWNVGTAGSSKWLTVMPYYFNEMAFQPSSTLVNGSGSGHKGAQGFDMDFRNGMMSIPVIRNGVRLAVLDDIYAMSERDFRLCLDRLVRPPQGSSNSDQYNVYKYGQANEGIPVISGRFTNTEYISTPRELGWFMVAPAFYLRVKDTLVANKANFGVTYFAAGSDYVNGDTSYRLRCWKGGVHVSSDILGAGDVNISRAQAFRQYWDVTPAAYMLSIGATASTYRPRLDVGFNVAMRQCFSSSGVTNINLVENQGVFIPFTIGYAQNSSSIQEQSNDDELKVIAFHKGLWGRLQRLPMVLSPWDTCDFTSGTGANYDPYDFAYMFGMAGTMASDYNQDLYNRTNQIQDQGWLYVKDPFVADSPVFKDSIKYTM